MERQNPIIVTLKLNDQAQVFFNALRQKYFPAERNFLDAHLTLFHALPGDRIESTLLFLKEIAQKNQAFVMKQKGWKSIGRGVAYVLESEVLQSLHKQMQQEWKLELSAQDNQKLWPHITIQNKVTSAEALQTLQLVEGVNVPDLKGLGFNVFYYKDGPWEFVKTLHFFE